ncbi:hypothetical protein GCM10022250_20680 [Flavobacterium chungbukense]|uniref:Uncharacterized protein n=1 Tax=Flavobacterium chungbukense TaxID=877464 RepID=A0ABP7Y426_9FLAO
MSLCKENFYLRDSHAFQKKPDSFNESGKIILFMNYFLNTKTDVTPASNLTFAGAKSPDAVGYV